MSGTLDGKVAVITGAASRIGRVTAQRFVEAGARVLAADIQDDAGKALEAEFPGVVRYQRCDVTSEDDIAAAMEAAVEAFGGIDVLFNNAGSGGPQVSIEDMTGELWDQAQALLSRSVALLSSLKVRRPAAMNCRTVKTVSVTCRVGSSPASADASGWPPRSATRGPAGSRARRNSVRRRPRPRP